MVSTIIKKLFSNQCKKFIYPALLLTFIIQAGCGTTQEQISTQIATTQTAFAALYTPTSTSTLTQTPNPTPTSSVTPTMAPTLTPDYGNATIFTIRDISFSVIVPEGWTISTEPTQVNLYGPMIDGIQTLLSFSLDQFSLGDTPLNADWMGIAMFSAHVQDTISGMVQNPVMVSEELFENPGGTPYFRWIMEHKTNGKKFHQGFYIFGSEKWFLTVMYGRAKSGGSDMDTLIDETMKTLKFEN